MSTNNSNRNAKDWATIAANFGVVIGLVLLAYELHQSNKLAETTAYIDRLDQMQQTAAIFVESEYLPEIYQKLGLDQTSSPVEAFDFGELSISERARLVSWERGVMLRMSGHYYQYLQGYLDEATGEKVLQDARSRYLRWKALGIGVEGAEFRAALE